MSFNVITPGLIYLTGKSGNVFNRRAGSVNASPSDRFNRPLCWIGLASRIQRFANLKGELFGVEGLREKKHPLVAAFAGLK